MFLANRAVAPWRASNTLFSVWIGINDIGNSFWLSNWDAFSDTLFDAYFALVQKLYDAGGRQFLFVNVPYVNRSPLVRVTSLAICGVDLTHMVCRCSPSPKPPATSNGQ